MDRKYPLESLILSRSYEGSTKINELLEQRYLTNDKPTLLLRPTEGEKEKQQTLLTKLRQSKTQYQNERKKDQTKVVFKKYIRKCIKLQKTLKTKITKFQINDVSTLKEFQEIPHIEEFYKLNELWIGYIQDILQLDLVSKKPIQIPQVLVKLSSADFNGCFIRVLKSKNSDIIGKNGIIIYDAKNFFIIVEPKDEKDPKSIGGLKMIEKKGTVFSFVIPLYDLNQEEVEDNDDNYLEFSIIGSRFQYRAPDRSGRKFKSKNVDDL
ncbi:Ribonucleases P/MRP protein subunit [Wickerhamomyces ciferrii]|uniref:Ribonuclease P protein subunit n=1 Tax=Wickerhamomyces ciferrii (strain ATCC 14091 / BCRC 22168 / CBS 111 / JCM 3599 / NBRC 0793 / NRRL Y-1031 F-60-10) TaxID=1206466 RepID=K0KYL3_WICCF|nr:Ribonucleases P/MRP protein subunit [Wickerhamomyces ciferrii]CCH46514.1 Ribonucleases P/MRP protein subunit [Wickerhamomyces ciferrii]